MKPFVERVSRSFLRHGRVTMTRLSA
jgi:hypothetical protein